MTQNNEDLLTKEERKELYDRLKFQKEEIMKSIIINRVVAESTKKKLLNELKNDEPSDYGRDGIRHTFRA